MMNFLKGEIHRTNAIWIGILRGWAHIITHVELTNCGHNGAEVHMIVTCRVFIPRRLMRCIIIRAILTELLAVWVG